MKQSKRWRCIESGINAPEWNMAVDEALLMSFREGDLPILRLYGWERSLSAGRFSKIHSRVNLEKLKECRISCVRRISGGGILVHGGDLSYALILPRESLRSHGVKESYRILCAFLIRLYEKLGFKADFACDSNVATAHSDICLAANEAYDIMIEGRKSGGNAQRYFRKVLFQHGSIPITLESETWDPIFLEDSGVEEAATLERLGRNVSYEELSESLKEAFCETFAVTLTIDALTPLEEERAKVLLADKYTQDRWNFDGKSV
ncbi:lipoate--protein ligase family protein [Sulfuricurvum sp.]|uniref:lipoate--protein ligase family protein n=1 Tax=Sulfuricurvum sp. TaxID=2025608 RepID=UPI003C548337